MKKLGPLFAVVVFGALFALYWFTAREEKLESDPITFKAPEIDPATVDRIEVGGTNKINLGRSGDDWKIEDGNYPADPDSVKQALDALKSLKVRDVVTSNKANHSKYQVDEAGGVPVKVFAKGKTVADIVLGKATADFQGTYFRAAGKDDVYEARARLATLLSKPVKSWRDLAMIKFDKDKVRDIVLEAPGAAPVKLHRDAKPAVDGGAATGGEWVVTEPPLPEGFKFDSTKVDRIVSTLANLRGNDTVDPAAEAKAAAEKAQAAAADGGAAEPPAEVAPTDYGLEPPQFVVTVVLDGGQTQKLALGHEKEGGAERYAKVDGRAAIYLMPKWQAPNVMKKLDDLRDFTILKAGVDDVAELTLKAGKTETTFTRADGGPWTLKKSTEAQPKGFELDPDAVDRVVAGVAIFQGDEWLPEALADKDSGLAAPTLVAMLRMKDGSEKRVLVGKDRDDAGSYVRGGDGMADGQPTYYARKWRLDRIKKSLADFQKKAPEATPPGLPQ